MLLRTITITALSAMMFAAIAVAQAASPPSSNEGAFDKLSPGNQKIAQALFDAEQNNSASPTTTPLSRDDIAAMKQDGRGWGKVFKEMKQQGLVDAKNLGQVVSQANHAVHGRTPGGTMITTGSGRTYMAGARPKPGYPEAAGQGKVAGGLGPQGESPGRSNYTSGLDHGNHYGNGNLSGGGAGRSGAGGRGKN